LANEVRDAGEAYHRSKHQDLETKLVEVHALATKAVGKWRFRPTKPCRRTG
jgi:hypothetical protein